MHFTDHYLTGTGADPTAEVHGHRLQPAAAEAFERLAAAAREAGFTLAIASGYRSFDRQLAIWNAKLSGARPVLDDSDREIALDGLSVEERLAAVLRFSALPGASRHHWGTDIDVYDCAAVSDGYRVQLSAGEVAESGPFGPLHDWLDARIEAGESFGFFRPYAQDRGGVAPERWHLSFAPLAQPSAQALSSECLLRCWQRQLAPEGMQLRDAVAERLDGLVERYVQRVDPPPEAWRSQRP